MEWEVLLLQFLEGLRGETLNKIFEIITVTGESGLLASIILITYWCINKTTGLKLGFIMLFSTLGNGFFKNIIKAPRPFESDVVRPIRKHTATGYSFPSGHTQGATTLWLALMIHIKKRWIYFVGSIMIVLVGVSRLYLGVHWPIDVLGAILLGTVLTVMSQYLFETIKGLSIANLLLSCFILGVTLLLGFDGGYTKVLGAMIGFMIGMVLEERYISFRVKGSLKYQVIKMMVGMAGLLVVAGGLKMVLPALIPFDFIRYMLIVIWVVAGAPYVFNKIDMP